MSKKNGYLIKIVIIILVLVAGGTYVFLNRQSGESALQKDTLIVGMELKFPPFETVDEKGTPTGVSVELAQALGKELGKNIEIKSLDYAGLIPALQSKNIDLIISSMTITEERLETIHFSNEYAKSDLGLALYKDVAANTYEDLNKEEFTIAAKQGTVGAAWAKTYLPKAKLKEFTEVSAALLDVNNGYSHAFIYDPLSLIEGSSNLSSIKLLLEPLPNVKGWGIGIRKDDADLEAAINTALDKVKSSDFFDTMREKYLKEEVEKYKGYGLAYFF